MMRESEFTAWLRTQGYKDSSIATWLSDCRKIDSQLGDLDAAFAADGCAGLLARLAYSTADERAGRPNPTPIRLDGNLYAQLATLRAAVSAYRRFCAAVQGEGGADASPIWLVTARHGDQDALPGFLEHGEWRLLNDAASTNNSNRMRDMAPGDHIVLRDYVPYARDLPFEAQGRRITAMRLRAIGTITENRGDGLSVAVDWTPLETPRTWYFYTHPQAVWRLHDPGVSAYADRLRQFILTGAPQDLDWFRNDPAWRGHSNDGQLAEQHQMTEPTNLILYGPPGTGKTYTTAREAVRLCDGAADYEETPEGRAALMQRYGELRDDGRIEFVTFHQSFSYEDFVEGLRPETKAMPGGEGGGFRLEPKAGVFRKICAHCELGSRSERITLAGRNVFKMSLGEANKAEWAWVFDQAMAEGYAYLGFGDIDWSNPRFADKQAILEACEGHRGALGQFTDGAPLSLKSGPVKSPDVFRNQVKVGDVIVVSKGLTTFRAIGVVEGDYEYAPNATGAYSHRRKVNWLWQDPAGLDVQQINSKQFGIDAIYQLAAENLRIPVVEGLINTIADAGNAGTLSHVLIIDEINRANVSKVFGELITLIEPDKRLGKANALTVKLPYSGDRFGVPANLHIIGTMNTADRSIALLDTALRRRFRFQEIAPEPDLLKPAAQRTGIDLPAVLSTINDRIEYLVDRDHRIGHAFFIGCNSEADVDAVMRDKVIPLLQEYFFEDWAKIAAVVGDGFVEKRILPAPLGLDLEEPRESWSVRQTFTGDRYTRLITGKTAVAATTSGPDGNGASAPDDTGSGAME